MGSRSPQQVGVTCYTHLGLQATAQPHHAASYPLQHQDTINKLKINTQCIRALCRRTEEAIEVKTINI